VCWVETGHARVVVAANRWAVNGSSDGQIMSAEVMCHGIERKVTRDEVTFWILRKLLVSVK